MPIRHLALIAAAGLFLAACSTGPTVESPPPAPATGTTTTTEQTVDPTDPGVDPTTTTTEAEGIRNPELEAAIDELVAITEDIRELTFKEPPKIVFVSEDELAERVRGLIEEELEADEVARDQAALALLGILEEGRDLRQLYLDLYSGVVAGYYDPEEGELVVPATDGELTASQKVTLVHELVHALTDQYFDFGSLGEQLDDEQRYEEALALTGVVEGDATLTEVLYFQTLSTSDQRDVINSGGGDPNALAGVPRYIQELLFFPYTTGAEFVVDIYQEGGFEAVNAAYQDPPTTSEQILDPDAYRNGEGGVTVTLEQLELDGYELGEESVWGETALSAMLGQNLVSSLVLDAADGWGGDRYQIYFDGQNVLFVFSYVGDTESDAEELARAITAYNAQVIAVDDFHFVERSGDRVVWLLADDPIIGAVAQAALTP